jgi:hypothetical protein
VTPEFVAPAPAAPGPDAAPFRWSRDVDPLFTREMMVLVAPALIIVVVILAGGAVVGAIAMPSQAALIIVLMVAMIVGLPLLMWAAVAFGNLEYGRPKATVWEIGPTGLRRANELGDPAIPRSVMTAFSALDAISDDPHRTHHVPERSSVDVIPWEDVSKATFDDERHVVLVHRIPKGRIPCYCGADEWPIVSAWARWGVDEGASRRAARA